MNFEDQIMDWNQYVERFKFHLPDDRIARYPSEKRDTAKMLVVHRLSGRIEDRLVRDLPEYLKSGDLLIRNTTRVSPRRVELQRSSGGKIEALFLSVYPEKSNDCATWISLLRGAGKLKEGEILRLSAGSSEPIFRFEGRYGDKEFLLTALNITREGPHIPAWKTPHEAESFFEKFGMMPIPPYLGRKADHSDKERYQTVYADGGRSVAAPTAGLHFTEELVRKLDSQGVHLCNLELIIGYGTFAPLTGENFRQKRLHSETYRIPGETASTLNKKKGRLIAVGTTTLRAVESEYRRHGGRYIETENSTDLFIHPPDQVKSIDGLMTNFHLPGSSLLMLVAAFAGEELTLAAYDHAVNNSYRFYSYGDTMLIL